MPRPRNPLQGESRHAARETTINETRFAPLRPTFDNFGTANTPEGAARGRGRGGRPEGGWEAYGHPLIPAGHRGRRTRVRRKERKENLLCTETF